MQELIKIIYQFFIIRQSGLFDENYYLNKNADIMDSGINPIIHYVKWGWKEGRDPSPNFNTSWYLDMNEDVASTNINPLFHYIKFGGKEGRQTQKEKISASDKKLNIRDDKNKSPNYKKRLIIHIGMPKTGSTSLQSFLFDNSDELKELGIFYPKQLHHHNIKFYPIFLDNPFDFIHQRKFFSSDEIARKKHDEYKKDWINLFENNDYRDFIISSELLYLCTKKQISKIYKLIEGYFDDVKIICYIREPVSFLRSHIQQGIKAGLIVEEKPENLIIKHSHACKYSKYLINWLDIFKNHSIEVVNFDQKYLYEGDIIKDFLHRIGYEDIAKDYEGIKKANVSLHTEVISFLYYFNQKYPVYLDGKINNQRGLKFDHAHIAKILKNIDKKEQTNQIKLSDALKEKLNNEIIFVNNLLSRGTKIPLLKLDGNKVDSFEITDVSLDLCIDITNECFNEIEMLLENLNRPS